MNAMHTGFPKPRRITFPLFLLALVILPSTQLRAQAVQGRVVDNQTEDGIEGASVALIRYGRHYRPTITDGEGYFFISLPGRGPYSLEASRIGYETSRSREFVAELTDTISVEFRLDAEAVLLDPLVVTGVSGRGRSRFDRHRTEWGKGVFLTPNMVDSIQPSHPSDLLLGQEKTRVTWTWSAKINRAIPNLRTYLGSGCLAYMVDFFPVIPSRWDPPIRGRRGTPYGDAPRTSVWEGTILEYLEAEDIVAVEFYRFIGEVPPELKDHAFLDSDISGRGGLSASSPCGLVVFWTRGGW